MTDHQLYLVQSEHWSVATLKTCCTQSVHGKIPSGRHPSAVWLMATNATSQFLERSGLIPASETSVYGFLENETAGLLKCLRSRFRRIYQPRPVAWNEVHVSDSFSSFYVRFNFSKCLMFIVFSLLSFGLMLRSMIFELWRAVAVAILDYRQ